MPITVAIEDNTGNRIRPIWSHPHFDAALRRADEEGSCLPFVDPYGDTIFNQIQLGTLLVELVNLRLELDDADQGDAIEQLVTLLRGVEGEVHTYIRFIGD
jgi:hypothetical protein